MDDSTDDTKSATLLETKDDHKPVLQRQSSISSVKSNASSTEGPDPASDASTPSAAEPKDDDEKPLRSSRSDSSLNGTFEVITESEVRESADYQTQQRPLMTSSPQPTPNLLSPASPSAAAGFCAAKKSRHILKEGTRFIHQAELFKQLWCDRVQVAEAAHFPHQADDAHRVRPPGQQ